MPKQKRKVCVVITARPSYSRIRSALAAIREHEGMELQLVVAASALLDRYGMAIQYMENDGFQVAAKVHMILEGENLVTSAKSTGIGLSELATVFDNLKPDIVVTVADRFETIATAIAASYMNIPLAHVQGGEVSGSIDDRVRHSVTKLSNYHFASTKRAGQRIISMGEDPATVFVTGCPSIDIAAAVMAKPEWGFDPIAKYGGVGASIDLTKDYLVVMQHPVTTEYDEARQQTLATLRAVDRLGMPTLWFWPNVDAGSDGVSKCIRAYREQHNPKNIHFFKNMEPEDFLKILLNSSGLLGNSSVGIRECTFMGVPAVNIGTRQRGRERGRSVVDCAYSEEEIYAAARKQIGRSYPRDHLYGDGRAGGRIAELLATVPPTFDKVSTSMLS